MLRLLYLITAFIGGFSIMGLELCGFRIFSPIFGYSIYVSGSLIGIIMMALSVGYIVGGKLADKYKSKALLFKLILAAGCYCFLMVFLYRDILDFCFKSVSRDMGTVAGILIATVVIYGPSMFLLSMISPYIIGLLAHEGDAGSTAGSVYGVSTIGSVFGTFLTSFVLVSAIGSHWTLIIFSGLVLLIGIIGLLKSSRMYLIGLAVFAVVPFSIPELAEGELLHTESFYNDIRVMEKKSKTDPSKKVRSIQVNWWTRYSTTLAEGAFLTQSYYDYFSLGPLLSTPGEILILGMGAGTSVQQFEKVFPRANIDAVEIDPEIVRIAKEYFDVKDTDKVKIFAEDARPFLKLSTKKYDVVELDLFQGGPYVPFYVTTSEFFGEVKERLADEGVVIMNILQMSKDKLLAACIVETLKSVFPSVYVIEASTKSNIMAIAFNREISLKEIKDRLEEKKPEYPQLTDVIDYSSKRIKTMSSHPRAHIFTDDKADIEEITFAMVEQVIKRIKRN
jgi:spermidine synthase